jgi:dihydroorotate dehydrogenase electron transfer subunit
MKYREQAAVLNNEQIGKDIFSLVLQTKQIAKEAVPGQFVSIYSKDKSRLLPRPISICEADEESGCLRLVFRIAGEGTREFSRLETGDRVDLVGPLGNGFPTERAEGKRVWLVGGGIGIPPMLQLDHNLEEMGAAASVTAILGYRDETFLLEDFSCGCVIATEDGSAGTKGNVLDAVRENGLKADVIYACGPAPMLRALKAYALEEGIECWLSMEEKMACGIGACLSCVCRSTEKDEHSQVNNKRICTEGPVFLSTDIEL